MFYLVAGRCECDCGFKVEVLSVVLCSNSGLMHCLEVDYVKDN